MLGAGDRFECGTIARARSARSLPAWEHGSGAARQQCAATTQICKKFAKISTKQATIKAHEITTTINLLLCKVLPSTFISPSLVFVADLKC